MVLDDDVAKVGLRHKVNAEVAGFDLTLCVGETEAENLVELPDV